MDLPREESLRWIVSHYARLRAAHGRIVDSPSLVEPTSAFFPDRFERDAASVARLMRRMMTYAPLADDLPIELRFLEPEGEQGGGCGSMACGSRGGGKGRADGVLDLGEGYAVLVSVTDVGHPVLLTTSLARSVGALVLSEASEDVPPEEMGPTSELAAVFCGLGLLLFNGSAVYAKSCGGLRLHQGTFLSVEELAVAVSLFVRVHDERPATVRRHAEATQKEAFDLALSWVDSNPHLVEALRDAPETLTDGAFRIEPTRGFFGRLFAKRSAKSAPPPDLARVVSRKSARTEAEQRRLAETAALVDEALRGS